MLSIVMGDDRPGDEKPDPLSDVFKGLSLILRAARTTVERMPKKGLEDAVVETAREVGRAIENVASVVEREVFGNRDASGQRRTGGPRQSDQSDPAATHDGHDDHHDEGPEDSGPPTPPHTD
jgi:hypothetical protein